MTIKYVFDGSGHFYAGDTSTGFTIRVDGCSASSLKAEANPTGFALHQLSFEHHASPLRWRDAANWLRIAGVQDTPEVLGATLARAKRAPHWASTPF